MPIISKSPPSSSPWYNIMAQMAHSWNGLASSLHADIEGDFQANRIRFFMQGCFGTCHWTMDGFRYLESLSQKEAIKNEPFTERFQLSIQQKDNKRDAFMSLRLKNHWSSWADWRKSFPHKKDLNNFSIRYHSEAALHELLHSPILEFEKLRRLRIDQKGLQMIMWELPSEMTKLKLIATFLKKNISATTN